LNGVSRQSDPDEMINRHERTFAGEASSIFRLLEDMGTKNDRVWPDAAIPFRRSAGPMRPGVTTEKHGFINATLCEYSHNERIVWSADLPFLKGTHGFHLSSGSGGETTVRHVLSARLVWWFVPVWHFRVARIHDCIIEGIFDRVENAVAASKAGDGREPKR
jgi:hypothetical protein